MKLKDLPKEQLPRERLIKYGKESLSDVELLAIILRSGTKDINVKTLAENLIIKYGSITNLKDLTINKAMEIKGLGLVKAVSLLASLELGKRVYEQKIPDKRFKIKNADDCYKYFSKIIENEKQENFLTIFLDNKNNVISYKIIFKGTINQSIVHPREVFKQAFLESSSSLIIMHNHPSGDSSPSKADDEVTTNFASIGEIMGIKLLDHIIIGNNCYYSYIESGRLLYE